MVAKSKTKKMTVKTAMELLDESVALKSEAERLMDKHGISVMLELSQAKKKQAADYMIENGIERIEIPTQGKFARLIQSVQERRWIGTKEDLPEAVALGLTATPLKSLVPKEVWMKLTRRIPDPNKIEQAVAEGVVKMDEIEMAYVERLRAPYVRIFDAEE